MLDNNVLASSDFNDIIDEIKEAGFYKGSTYVAPNYYEIAIKNIQNGYNVTGYLKSLVKQYKLLVKKTNSLDEKREIIEK